MKLALQTIVVRGTGKLSFLIFKESLFYHSVSQSIELINRVNLSFAITSRMPSSLSATNQVNNNNNQKGLQSNSKKSSSEKTYFNMNPGRVNACMIKTFNRMKKRIGFLIYQFVLPAIQVRALFYFLLFKKLNHVYDFREKYN